MYIVLLACHQTGGATNQGVFLIVTTADNLQSTVNTINACCCRSCGLYYSFCCCFNYKKSFAKQEAANGRGDAGKMEVTKKEKAGAKLSVERVYQKKTQLEHILLRPDTYIGSVEPITQVSLGY